MTRLIVEYVRVVDKLFTEGGGCQRFWTPCGWANESTGRNKWECSWNGAGDTHARREEMRL